MNRRGASTFSTLLHKMIKTIFRATQILIKNFPMTTMKKLCLIHMRMRKACLMMTLSWKKWVQLSHALALLKGERSDLTALANPQTGFLLPCVMKMMMMKKILLQRASLNTLSQNLEMQALVCKCRRPCMEQALKLNRPRKSMKMLKKSSLTLVSNIRS